MARLVDWTPVLLALPLYAVAIGWGWGPEHLWSWDEPRPVEIVAPPYTEAPSWPVKYPLLHRDLVRALFATVDPVAAFLGVGEAAGLDRARFLAGRSLTVLLALWTVRLAFVVARHGRSPRAGWIAAFAWLAVLPQTYYAKTMNLDAPYVFWLALASWAFVRLRVEPRLGFSLAFFGAVAAAVLTKDQALGLFVLPVVVLLVDAARGRWRATGAPPAALLIGLPVLAGVALAAASYRLASGGELLRRHLAALIAVPGTYAVTAPDLASPFDQVRLALRHIAWSFGWPLAISIAAGIALAFVRRRDGAAVRPGKSSAVLLLFPLSYAIFALAPLGYHYDRFFLPVCWIFAVVAAGGIADFWERPGARGYKTFAAAMIVAAVAWGLWRCAALDRAMVGDRRNALEAATRGLPRATLARFAVRAPQGFERLQLPARGDVPLARLTPYEVVVIPAPDLGDLRLSRLARALRGGACGFRAASPELARASPLRRWIDFDGVLSNLGEVDPPLAVFRRDPPLLPCAPSLSGE